MERIKAVLVRGFRESRNGNLKGKQHSRLFVKPMIDIRHFLDRYPRERGWEVEEVECTPEDTDGFSEVLTGANEGEFLILEEPVDVAEHIRIRRQ